MRSKKDLSRENFRNKDYSINEESYIKAHIDYWSQRLEKLGLNPKAKELPHNKPTKEQWKAISYDGIGSLNLSKRTRRILKINGFESIYSLVLASESKLLKLAGFGRVSLDDVRKALNKISLHLYMDLSNDQ